MKPVAASEGVIFACWTMSGSLKASRCFDPRERAEETAAVQMEVSPGPRPQSIGTYSIFRAPEEAESQLYAHDIKEEDEKGRVRDASL